MQALLLLLLLLWRWLWWLHAKDVVGLLQTIGVVVLKGGLLRLDRRLLLQEGLSGHLVETSGVLGEPCGLLLEATETILIACGLRVLVVQEAGCLR